MLGVFFYFKHLNGGKFYKSTPHDLVSTICLVSLKRRRFFFPIVSNYHLPIITLPSTRFPFRLSRILLNPLLLPSLPLPLAPFTAHHCSVQWSLLLSLAHLTRHPSLLVQSLIQTDHLYVASSMSHLPSVTSTLSQSLFPTSLS